MSSLGFMRCMFLVLTFVATTICVTGNQESSAFDAKGFELAQQGDYAAAVEQFNQALAIDQGDYYALYNKGSALLSLGSYEEALAATNAALDINKGDPDAWVNRAAAIISLARAGYFSDSTSAYQQAIVATENANNIKPSARAYFHQGLAYWDLGDTDGAFNGLNYALNYEPENSKYREAFEQFKTQYGITIEGTPGPHEVTGTLG
jgi:tetratricopeptide (TPR) repeat protein